MITITQLAEEIQEMVQNGASVSDLIQKLGPYHKAFEKQVEQSWKDNPDTMGGQFTDYEIEDAGWQ